MATDLCFPILKYSHAIGVRSDNSIPWTHLQASDIFVIVAGKDTYIADGQLTLRVVQGNRVLESIDVAQYVDSAVDARRGAEQHGVTPQVEQLPIFGITKDALLAIRYRPTDGQARRLQLRMETATHCRQIVDAFVRRGMEFQEQRPGTARQGAARPATATNADRLLTANASSPYFEPNKHGTGTSQTRTQAHEIGSLPRLPSARPERSPTRDAVQTTVPSRETPPSSLLTRDEVAAPREVVPDRPSTAQIYRSYTTPSQPLLYEPPEVPRRPSDPTGEWPGSISHVATLATIREAVEAEATPPRIASDMPPPTLRPAFSNEHWSTSTPEPNNLTALLADPADGRPQSARPSTATTTVPPENLDHELPPRRELPFKRPDSRRRGSCQGSSRPGTSAMSLPPLPKPTLRKKGSGSPVRADSLSPEKPVIGSRPGTASLLKRSINASEDGLGRAQTAVSSATIAQAFTPCDSSRAKRQRVTEQTAPPETAARKPTSMEELLYGRKPLASQSSNASRIPRTNSLADAPHEKENPPASPPKATHRSTENDPTINAYHALRSPTHGGDGREVSIGEYATQSLQDRQAVLEEFMMDNLENPAFGKLCEDVENCWRRIALGL